MIADMRNAMKRVLLRDAKFTANYGRLRLLYSMADPWDLASEKEQHRFQRTNELLAEVAPGPGTLLEVGCGEGHQSAYLCRLGKTVYGLDVSDQAVRRARVRCPEATFACGRAEQADRLFGPVAFDLAVACEVLYYASDVAGILRTLQGLAPQLFISNYQPRSEVMRPHFAGPGWRRLDDIRHGDTVWECFLWTRP